MVSFSSAKKTICLVSIGLYSFACNSKIFAAGEKRHVTTTKKIGTITLPFDSEITHVKKVLVPEEDSDDYGEEVGEDVLLKTDYEEEVVRDDMLLKTEFVAETNLPTDLGMFRLRAYRHSMTFMNSPFSGNEPTVIYSPKHPITGPNAKNGRLAMRVHDQCVTGEVFGSRRCDCRDQLRMALKYIDENGGAIIYLQQEGRGIGLANKVAAYSLQDDGFDTVDANTHLGFPEDWRQYGMIPSILKDLGVPSIRLITNNPRKVKKLTSLGIKVEDTIPIVIPQPDAYNRKYLETKRNRMDHMNFGNMLSKRTTNKIAEDSVKMK
eukprot:CAMPEP_0194146206 /NCGR_PEP_ID=MMETSP0152-20130528/20410_1 /TAXON_ID=1049557 /ORGANISM="Thalassiothrix antarctica, Strain L6-D1" /LENGTH=321 /DNA_ID=CAMNT_0038846683 /DNA_START=26 /DNA_END=991 /DNA_ORIENTATION=+